MQNPLVSVIVPVFNAERTLPRLMASLLGQTLAALEIILVDDHSTDGSLTLCRQYAQAAPERVRVVTPQAKGYAGGCRNAGMDAARGIYVGFVDADDAVEADMFAELAAAAEAAGAEVAVCGLRREGEEGAREILPAAVLTPETLAADRRLSSAMWNKLVRVDWLRARQLRCPAVRCAEDAAFMLKLLSQAPRIIAVPAPLYRYSVHGKGLSASMAARRDVLAAMADVRFYVKIHPPCLPFRAIYRHAVFLHAVYHPLCLLCIDSLWHGRRRWENLRETPAYVWRLFCFFCGYTPRV